MKNTVKALTLTSVLAFAQVAWAGGNEQGHGNDHGGKPPVTQPTQVLPNDQSQLQSQTQGQSQGQSQGQTATGIGVGTGIASSTSGASAGASAVNGAITNTNGASASTGPITNTNGASASTGAIKNDSSATALGGASQSTSQGGASNVSTGAVNVAPQQSTVNNFRSFVGTNAPNLSGSVDNCLAVLGWSAAVNVFGATGVGLGGGNQRTEYVEQCAAVKSAFEVWNRSNGDVNKETFAIDLLIKALPTYGKPAMDSAVNRINTYIETNGDTQPDSVMNIFGAKSFRKKEADATVPAAPAAVVAAPAPVAPSVTVVVNPIVQTRETRVIVGAKKADPVKKPDCACKQ